MEELCAFVGMEMRKNQTRACTNCKQRHHKCSGKHPCHFCLSKNLFCVFKSQGKRGPKPKKAKLSSSLSSSPSSSSSSLSSSPSSSPLSSSPSSSSLSSSPSPPSSVSSSVDTSCFIDFYTHSPNYNEVSLWRENENCKAVQSFFDLRSWWNFLLDSEALKSPSNTFVKIQTLLVSATIARFLSNKDRAQEMFNTAKEMLRETKNIANKTDKTTTAIEYASTLLLMADYYPDDCWSFCLRAWESIKHIRETDLISPKHQKIHSYIAVIIIGLPQLNKSCLNKMCEDTILQLTSKKTADVWDISLVLVTRIMRDIFIAVTYEYKVSFIEDIKNLQLTYDTATRLLKDLNTMMWIFTSNMDSFGVEYWFWYMALKVVIIWKKGDKNGAICAAVEYIGELRRVGPLKKYLSDLPTLVVPFLILQEAGMSNLLREGLDLLVPVAFATDQHQFYSEVFVYFFSSKPSLSSSSSSSFDYVPLDPLPFPSLPMIV